MTRAHANTREAAYFSVPLIAGKWPSGEWPRGTASSIGFTDQLSSNLLGEIDIAPDIQILPVVLNLNSKIWFLLPIYKPPKQNDNYFREHMLRVADFYTMAYDDVLAISDFNQEESSPTMLTMMNGSQSLQSHSNSNML